MVNRPFDLTVAASINGLLCIRTYQQNALEKPTSRRSRMTESNPGEGKQQKPTTAHGRNVYGAPLLSSSQDVLLRNIEEVICTVFEVHRRHLRIKEAEQEIDTGGATEVAVPRP